LRKADDGAHIVATTLCGYADEPAHLKPPDFSLLQQLTRRLSVLLICEGLLHALLDALTNGGLGVALLSPLSNARFFFLFRPILVSPIGTGFFSEYGVKVLGSEILWIWMPAFFIAAGTILWRRLMKKVQASGTD
jgi:hypothetical protein